MEIVEEFNTNENKGMLWQLLYEQGAFNNISDEYIRNIKLDFDNIANNIDKNTSYSLKDKNKLLIKNVVSYLEKYKEKTTKINKPLEEVQIKLDKDLKEKEKEFIELIKRPSPAEIDFTDKIDEPLNETSVNSMLNKMIAEREIEINKFLPPIPSAKEDNETKETSQTSQTSQKLTKDFFNNLLNSNDNSNDTSNDTSISNINIITKSVSFEIDDIIQPTSIIENNSNNSNNSNIINMLEKILLNQEKIMKKLDI